MDAATLGEEHQVGSAAGLYGGGAGAVLTSLGLTAAKRFAKKYFHDMAFCSACRSSPSKAPDPFRSTKILTGVGFFIGLIPFFGFPVAWVLFIFAWLNLRKRLAEFKNTPDASVLPSALNALGTFMVAVVAHMIFVLVFGTVVLFTFLKKNG